MKTITVADDMLATLEFVQGNDLQEKIGHLLENNLLLQLRECEEHLFKYESRYGMDFESFAAMWESGGIKDRHSHEVERDYMEWEGFDQERTKLLNALRAFKMKKEK